MSGRLFQGLALAAVLAGCSSGTGNPAASPSPPCISLPAAPTSGDTPLALMHDLAGGPYEYLLGHPGGPIVRLNGIASTNLPRLAGGRLFMSTGALAAPDVYAGPPGGCASRLAPGALGDVERQGRAFTAISPNRYLLVDGHGKTLAHLGAAAGHFTPDGHFVQPSQGRLIVYDLGGKRREYKGDGTLQPLGPLGTNREMVVGASAAVQLLDLDTLTTAPLGKAASELRFPSGSPDGTHIAMVDQAGNGQLLDLKTGKTRGLPHPGPTTGFAWSPDGGWLAVQTLYGGVAVRVADLHVIDLGPLAVVTW